jgi:hypothetical protein
MYRLYDDGYIGMNTPNLEMEWRDSKDSESEYLDNIKKYPNELSYFKDRKLIYKFNDYGHRCKNINEINLDNYILFVGCSHTEGTGNYLEDTFPYIISKNLKCDYYNLGVKGAGLDVQLHNLTIWILKNKPPKYLVWQWTHEPRFVLRTEDSRLLPFGAWNIQKKYIDFILAAQDVDYMGFRRETASTILKNLNIPTIQIDVYFTKETIPYRKIDMARDTIHYGPNSNNLISNMILHYISNKYTIR